MRALVLDNGPHYITDQPEPSLKAGEAVVRVLLAGICNTDLELVKGYMQFSGVLGHEFVGKVEACGEGSWVGKRVVGEINCGCGVCSDCRGGDSRHCPRRTVLGIVGRHGAFAEYLALPIANLHEVPAALSNEDAVFTEPLAAAFETLEQVRFRPTDRVLVLGDGKLGLLVAQVLAGTQCELLVVGKHASKLEILAARGIPTMLLEQWRAANIYDIVVECSGSAQGLALAVTAARPRGTVVLKTTTAEAVPLHLAPLVIGELTVVGSRCGPFAPALRALAAARVSVEPLRQTAYDLSDGLQALQHAAEPGMLKTMLRVEG